MQKSTAHGNRYYVNVMAMTLVSLFCRRYVTLVTFHDQLVNQAVGTSANQQWQHLVDEMQAAWQAEDPELAKELFADLVVLSTPLLLTIARAKAPAQMDEDVVAEAYLEFYELLAAHTPINNAKALLCHIVRLRSIDAYRRQRRAAQVMTQVDETTWSGLRELPDVLSATPEELIVTHDSANLLLDALSDEQRQVLIMRRVYDFTVTETAAHLHLTNDQVKKRTREALADAYHVAQERGLLHDFP